MTELNVLIADTYYKISVISIGRAAFFFYKTQGRRFKNVNRKVQGVALQEATANPWHQEEEKKDKKNKACKISKQLHEKHTDQLFLPQVRWSQC